MLNSVGVRYPNLSNVAVNTVILSGNALIAAKRGKEGEGNPSLALFAVFPYIVSALIASWIKTNFIGNSYRRKKINHTCVALYLGAAKLMRACNTACEAVVYYLEDSHLSGCVRYMWNSITEFASPSFIIYRDRLAFFAIREESAVRITTQLCLKIKFERKVCALYSSPKYLFQSLLGLRKKIVKGYHKTECK